MRKLLNLLRLIVSFFFSVIYIPHIILYLLNRHNHNKDIKANYHNLKMQISYFCSFIYLLHNNKYYRTLFYHRTGPIFKFFFGWYRPGSKYFQIANSCQLDYGIALYHPYCTIINADKIGEGFSVLHLTTLGAKNNGEKPKIGKNVKLGASVIIIGDITIGDNVIVGAGSVVTRDVPNNCIVAGNPARLIKCIH